MPKALISVFDKTNIEDFAKSLVELGWEIISTGGTLKALADAGVAVTSVSDLTGFPEILDGRVKTLHPKVYGGILANRDLPDHLDQLKQNEIDQLDMVVVNLYPFEQVVAKPDVSQADAIENIDIGGPSMLRAGAKNFKDVIVLSDPADYQNILDKLKQGEVDQVTRKELAAKVFARTAKYNQAITNFLSDKDSDSDQLQINLTKLYDLRYGENPHQKATFYKDQAIQETSIATAKILQGKQLSYNNIVDADAALNIVRDFSESTVAIIKHTNPCGCAIGDDINQAYTKAYACDPTSAFGGIIAMNETCTVEIAKQITKIFVEMVLAPDFEPEALKLFKAKKNLRLLKLGKLTQVDGLKEFKKVSGGLLVQDLDRSKVTADDIKTVTKLSPTDKQLADLLFAWKVAKHVKSNAIVIAKDGAAIGVGAGQMSRVESTGLAIKRAGDQVKGAVVASDAFFPFRDNIDLFAQAGLSAVIQPGGSVKDEEVIAAADEHDLVMVLTGIRVFRH